MRMVPKLKVLTTAPVRKDTLGMINHAKVRNSTFGVPQMVQNNKKCLPNLSYSSLTSANRKFTIPETGSALFDSSISNG